MNTAINIGTTLISAGNAVTSAIIYPKLFLLPFMDGICVRAPIAIVCRLCKGKSETAEGEEVEANLKQKNPEQYKKLLADKKIKAIKYLIYSLFQGGLNGYLLYAHLTSQVVNPFFSFLGGAGAIVCGFGWGYKISTVILDKMIMALDQQRPVRKTKITPLIRNGIA
jgi:hypothetical protein